MNHQAQVTALTCCDNMLLVGTQGGYLLIFNIHHKAQTRTRTTSYTTAPSAPSSQHTLPQLLHTGAGKQAKSGPVLDYSLVAATHCCAQPVVSIHSLGLGSSRLSSLHSPTLSNSATHSLNILVLFAGETSVGESTHSKVSLYEMTRGSSPLESPQDSPQSSVHGRVYAGSSQSLPVGSLKRCSLHDLDMLPELTLHRVTKGSVSYLPLQEKSSIPASLLCHQ